MGYESVTDQKITTLLTIAKGVTNPKTRESNKDGHTQRNYKVRSADGQEFTLYVRQNLKIEDDFSCGLQWHMPSGDSLTLVRYNGSSHWHPNRLEKTEIDFSCHIHRATEKYIKAERKPEGFAEQTDRYSTLSGALHCLVTDCKISGLSTAADHPKLF